VIAQAAVDPYRFQPHPEVWVLVAGLIALGTYAVKVIGPKVVPEGEPIATRRQKVLFATGLLLLWICSDWPIHDLAEDYLYSIHMSQHLVLTMIVPPVLLLAVPEWLGRLVLAPETRIGGFLATFARPVPAAIIFAAATMLTHWSSVVDLSLRNGAFHFGIHVLIVMAAILVWMPVCSPLPELRASLPAQMVYLFLLSVPPTVPGAWLTVAEDVVYQGYDRAERLWGISVIADQQTAGLIMKLAGGFYLWGVIVVLFFKWSAKHEALNADARQERTRMRAEARSAEARLAPVGSAPGRSEADDSALTYESVAAQFEASGPAPAEADRG